MKLSIITPVYNDPRVGRALASIRAQRDAGDVEVIVIDGGSNAATQAVLAEHRTDIDVLVSERDAGIYDAMNKGLTRATGDVVGLLNADDVYADDLVLADVRRSFSQPGTDVTYGDVLLVADDGRPVRLWRAGRFSRRRLFWGWMPPHPGFFVRRELYERHGGFRTDLPIAADYEHQLRLFLVHDATPQYVPRVLVRFTVGGQSSGSLRKVLEGNSQVRRAWRLNGLRGGAFAPFLKPLQKLPQYARPIAMRWRQRPYAEPRDP